VLQDAGLKVAPWMDGETVEMATFGRQWALYAITPLGQRMATCQASTPFSKGAPTSRASRSTWPRSRWHLLCRRCRKVQSGRPRQLAGRDHRQLQFHRYWGREYGALGRFWWTEL